MCRQCAKHAPLDTFWRKCVVAMECCVNSELCQSSCCWLQFLSMYFHLNKINHYRILLNRKKFCHCPLFPLCNSSHNKILPVSPQFDSTSRPIFLLHYFSVLRGSKQYYQHTTSTIKPLRWNSVLFGQTASTASNYNI